jgi:hypothetical protein
MAISVRITDAAILDNLLSLALETADTVTGNKVTCRMSFESTLTVPVIKAQIDAAMVKLWAAKSAGSWTI